jgi:hypothetical protein
MNSYNKIYKLLGEFMMQYDISPNPPVNASDGVWDEESGMLLFTSSSGVYFLNGKSFSMKEAPDEFSNMFNNIEKIGNQYMTTSSHKYIQLMGDTRMKGGMFHVHGDGIVYDQILADPVLDGSLLCEFNNEMLMYSSNYNVLFTLKYFNGYNFDSITYMPVQGLIRDIKNVKNESLFILFDQGVMKFTNGVNDYFDKSNVPGFDTEFYTMTSGLNGEVWVGAKNGLHKFENRKWTSFPIVEGIYDIKSITTDNKNRIWIAGLNGIIMFDGIKWIPMDKILGLPNDEYTYIEFMNGKLYASSCRGLVEISFN